jgi:hypothetical protein
VAIDEGARELTKPLKIVIVQVFGNDVNKTNVHNRK